jgi:hypothetical protein
MSRCALLHKAEFRDKSGHEQHDVSCLGLAHVSFSEICKQKGYTSPDTQWIAFS